mgnify:CR=1 FL=1
MVAKSYQKLTFVDEPYAEKNGKMYQKVLNENTGKIYKVRWYTEDEYYKMYPEDRPEIKPINQKKILGFEEGYVTIFKGDQEKWEYWLSKSIARYCRFWGWYIISTDPIPFDVPAELELVRLDWDRVGQSTGELKSEEEIQAELTALLYNTHPSVYQGAVGDRLELNVTVIKTVQQDKFFGGKSTKNTIHTFEDASGNHYMWDTGAKNWAEGLQKKIRGTVKEHKIINNVQTTVLTRCMEVMK